MSKYLAYNKRTGLYFSRVSGTACFLALRENAEKLTYTQAKAVKYIFDNVELEEIKKQAPRPQRLARRLTRRYRAFYNHLDRWHDLGSFVALSSKTLSDKGDSYKKRIRVKVELAGAYRTANVIRALIDSVEDGCSCEHDCCGHYQRHGESAKHVDGDLYEVVVSAHANI